MHSRDMHFNTQTDSANSTNFYSYYLIIIADTLFHSNSSIQIYVLRNILNYKLRYILMILSYV